MNKHPKQVDQEQQPEAATGAGQPKVDVSAPHDEPQSQPSASEGVDTTDKQVERANDQHPSGLTASEAVRMEKLSRKQVLTTSEREELEQLGYKREHGLPKTQVAGIQKDVENESEIVDPVSK